jgi:hypothetical protein
MLKLLFMWIRTHVRQLIALVLSPVSLLPHSSRGASAGWPTGNSSDPDPFSPSARQISQQALALLKAWLATNHPKAILRALPGFEPEEGEEEEWDDDDDEESDVEMRVNNNKKQRRKSTAEEDDDFPVTLAGKRVLRCADLWDVLAGCAKETPGVLKPNTRERAVGEEWGWELAELLIAGFARDRSLHEGRSFSFLASSESSFG